MVSTEHCLTAWRHRHQRRMTKEEARREIGNRMPIEPAREYFFIRRDAYIVKYYFQRSAPGAAHTAAQRPADKIDSDQSRTYGL